MEYPGDSMITQAEKVLPIGTLEKFPKSHPDIISKIYNCSNSCKEKKKYFAAFC